MPVTISLLTKIKVLFRADVGREHLEVFVSVVTPQLDMVAAEVLDLSGAYEVRSGYFILCESNRKPIAPKFTG